MALRDTIKLISDDMSILAGLANSIQSEIEINLREGFADVAPSITAELNSLVASRKSIEKQLMSIKSKTTTLVKVNIDSL